MQLELESVVEAFERARSSDPTTELRDFAPEPAHPQYLEIMVELIRADLEFSFQDQRPRPLRHYLDRFPVVLKDRAALTQVAFEEYRLSFNAGLARTPTDYAKQYRIDTSHWPSWSLRDPTSSVVSRPLEMAELDEMATTRQSERISNGEFVIVPRLKCSFPDVGTRFGDFELVDELGRGAFGRVFLARQDDLAGRLVALKVTVEPNAEPQRLAELQHTNIVPIYSVHRVGHLQAVCMPFLGSATLADVCRELWRGECTPTAGREFVEAVLAQRASIPVEPEPAQCQDRGFTKPFGESSVTRQLLADLSYEDAVIWVTARIADGLAHAHERGVIHRDLKPANILVSDDGLPLILDFHLSTLIPSRGSDAAVVGGTLPYLAPEHIETLQTGGTVNVTSDVYALGVILFELLTGRIPFPVRRGPAGQLIQQMLADRRSGPLPLRHLNSSVSPDVESIIAHCLWADPARRYSSARELQTDLERHLKDLPPRFARRGSLRERARKWTRRHPRIASATTIGICAAVLMLGLAAGLIAGKQQLARVAATDKARQFDLEWADALPPLATHHVDFGSLNEAIQTGNQLLKRQNAWESNRWRDEPPLTLLDAPGQQSFEQAIIELRCLVAAGCIRAAERVDDPARSDRLLSDAARLIKLSSEFFTRTPRALLLQHARLEACRGHSDTARTLREVAGTVSVDTPFERHLLAFALKSHEADESLMQWLREESPQNPLVWYMLGNLLGDKERHVEAVECYSSSIAIAPQMVWAYLFRGNLRYLDEQFDLARKDFESALKIRPNWSPALFGRALVSQAQGRYQDALNDMSSALEHGATETQIYFVRSRLRAQLGDLEGAECDREQGLKLIPTDWSGWVSRGVHQLPRSPEKALADFRKAASLKPGSAEPWKNIASVLSEKLGNVEEAVEAMDRVIERSPEAPKAFATRGVLHARLGRRAKAHRDGEAALRLDQSPDTLYRVCAIFAQTSVREPRDSVIALSLFQEAARRNPRLVLSYLSRDSDLEPLAETVPFRDFASLLRELVSPDSLANSVQLGN
jgi:serine/threonine protein kinase/lipoprotein NlpI